MVQRPVQIRPWAVDTDKQNERNFMMRLFPTSFEETKPRLSPPFFDCKSGLLDINDLIKLASRLADHS